MDMTVDVHVSYITAVTGKHINLTGHHYSHGHTELVVITIYFEEEWHKSSTYILKTRSLQFMITIMSSEMHLNGYT